jgi:phospholipase C
VKTTILSGGFVLVGLLGFAALLGVTPTVQPNQEPRPASAGATGFPIQHVIIIDKENHSFDNMFGLFPGADGASHARLSSGEVVALIRTPDRTLLDVGHAGAAASLAVNNGRMDGFDLLPGAEQNGRIIANSQYQRADIPNYWRYAQTFALDDHFSRPSWGQASPTTWSWSRPVRAVRWTIHAVRSSMLGAATADRIRWSKASAPTGGTSSPSPASIFRRCLISCSATM